MKLLINILLFFSFFIIIYLIIYQCYISKESDGYKKRINFKVSTKENSLKNFFSKINFISSKENFLSKQGYPLKLNAISYYFVKFFLACLLLVAGSVNYSSMMQYYICQAYTIGYRNQYFQSIKKGLFSYIDECSDVENFFVRWIDFMGCNYRDALLMGGHNSAYVSEGVYEMMLLIKEHIASKIVFSDICKRSNEFIDVCERTLTSLRSDSEKWRRCSHEIKMKYITWTEKLVEMIESIKQAPADDNKLA